jgi:hypothetical protein
MPQIMPKEKNTMSKSFKTKKLFNNCLLFKFKNQKELALSFCRVQEYYEGKPGVQGKLLSFESFIDEYMDKEGNIEYFNYWTGFNIPGYVFSEWFKVNATEKTKWELTLAEAVASKLDLTKPFYVIGALEDDAETIDHEIAHALYYMDDEYSKTMDSITYQFYKQLRKQYSRMVNRLKDMGYAKSVIKDEIQAYMSTSNKKELVDDFDLNYDEIRSFQKLYKNVLLKYNTIKK